MYLRQPVGMAGTWDNIVSTLKGGAKGVVSFYGQAQRDAGAAAALQAQMAAQQAAARPAAGGGITATHLAIGGAALVALVLLLRK